MFTYYIVKNYGFEDECIDTLNKLCLKTIQETLNDEDGSKFTTWKFKSDLSLIPFLVDLESKCSIPDNFDPSDFVDNQYFNICLMPFGNSKQRCYFDNDNMPKNYNQYLSTANTYRYRIEVMNTMTEFIEELISHGWTKDLCDFKLFTVGKNSDDEKTITNMFCNFMPVIEDGAGTEGAPPHDSDEESYSEDNVSIHSVNSFYSDGTEGHVLICHEEYSNYDLISIHPPKVIYKILCNLIIKHIPGALILTNYDLCMTIKYKNLKLRIENVIELDKFDAFVELAKSKSS